MAEGDRWIGTQCGPHKALVGFSSTQRTGITLPMTA